MLKVQERDPPPNVVYTVLDTSRAPARSYSTHADHHCDPQPHLDTCSPPDQAIRRITLPFFPPLPSLSTEPQALDFNAVGDAPSTYPCYKATCAGNATCCHYGEADMCCWNGGSGIAGQYYRKCRERASRSYGVAVESLTTMFIEVVSRNYLLRDGASCEQYADVTCPTQLLARACSTCRSGGLVVRRCAFRHERQWVVLPG